MATDRKDPSTIKLWNLVDIPMKLPEGPGVTWAEWDPLPITEADRRLLKEAEFCHKFIEKRVGLYVRRIRELVESGYSKPLSPREVTPKDMEEYKRGAENMLAELREISAILRGAKNDKHHEVRTLVSQVQDTAPGWRRRLMIGLAEARKYERGQRLDVEETLDGTVEAFFAIAECEMSPSTFDLLSAPKAREHVRLAIGYRGRFLVPQNKRTTAAPRWLEPLFIAALEAGLVIGGSMTAKGWYDELLKLGFLDKEKTVKVAPRKKSKGSQTRKKKGKTLE